MLMNKIHDRTIMPMLGERFGMKAMTDIACDEWMAASPNYSKRARQVHNIDRTGVDATMKGLQLDIGAPHMWLKFHYDYHSPELGYF